MSEAVLANLVVTGILQTLLGLFARYYLLAVREDLKGLRADVTNVQIKVAMLQTKMGMDGSA